MSGRLLGKAAREGRSIAHVTPESAGWRYVGFEALRLGTGEKFEARTGPRELCIVVVAGHVSVASGELSWKGLGNRASPFEDVAPYAVYLPPGRDVHIVAEDAAEVALCWAPAKRGVAPRLIEPATMKRTVRGQGSNTRFVRDILERAGAVAQAVPRQLAAGDGHMAGHDDDAQLARPRPGFELLACA